jgi:hypothetical protein
MSDAQLQPFLYSAVPHRRKHGPRGYDNYQAYKDWLRDEYSFRCVYCLEREMWDRSRSAAFSADHVQSQAEYPDLICDYENLVYSCLRCNAPKQHQRLIDPTVVAFHDHLRMEADGMMKALTPQGERMIHLLRLNIPPAIDVRRYYLNLLALKRQFPDNPEVDRMYREAFGFPDDLPNLEAKREPANSRPEGKQDCYWRQRAEGRLPSIY